MGNWWLFNPRKWVATTLSMVGLLWFPLSLQAEPIADSFRFPLEGSWSPSRGFAKKFISDWCGFHLADDIPRDSDTPVFPTAKGVVKFEGVVFGYTVVIEHLLSNGSYVTSVYYHMKRPADGGIKLTLGQELDPKAALGFVSGLKKDHGSAPHLHFGIRKGSFRKGKDLRTEKWYYPGYTTIYKGGVRQCNELDPVHKEIKGEWEDPAEFINAHISGPSPPQIEWLSFLEGNPGIPGDGVVVNTSLAFFNLSVPIALIQFTDGFTTTVFLSSQDTQKFGYFQINIVAIINNIPFYPCSFGVSGFPATGNIVYNDNTGVFMNMPQSFTPWMGDLIKTSPNCANITTNDLFIYGFVLYTNSWDIITTLDAAMIRPGQNNFP